ncbi:MAG: hypothetical protein Q8L63_01095, partial [Alphaproteobacteria bacterium]|nr:hypothetical protein [Alphaproteobacteria bacterium]
EQELKLYISEALELAVKCIGSRMPFRMSGVDFENEALGRLILTFQKLSANEDLVRELRRFLEHRNYLSHKGIVRCLNPDGELDSTQLEDLDARLAQIRTSSAELCARIGSLLINW